MELGMVLALVGAIPVVLFPAAFVWYLNVGGIVGAVRDAMVAKVKKVAAAKVSN